VPNRKVSIIEKVKIAGGRWTNLSVKIPKSKPNGRGLYLKDSRDGKFYLVWREGEHRRYHPVHGPLRDAITAKEQKELYLAGIAKGLHVEDPSLGNTRLTIAAGFSEYLSVLTGRGNTVPLHTFALRQFEEWNTKHARNKKLYLDAIDRQHVLAFKKWAMEQGDGKTGGPNDEVTAVWKCMRVNKAIKTMLNLGPGQGPVKKSDFAEVLNRKPTVVTYTKDERERFLACCEGAVFLIWSLFLKSGLRLKELSHLEWTDIEWFTHVIHIRLKMVKDGDKQVEFRPKKHSIRDVAIADDLFKLLEELRKMSKSHLVFPTRTGRINIRLWDSCKRIATRAGVDASKFMPKNFRSTYATNRLRQGYTLAEVRDQLGHRDMRSVEHYADALKAEELVKSGRASAGWD
jgi:integrase